jgi:hypothetical protein
MTVMWDVMDVRDQLMLIVLLVLVAMRWCRELVFNVMEYVVVICQHS